MIDCVHLRQRLKHVVNNRQGHARHCAHRQPSGEGDQVIDPQHLAALQKRFDVRAPGVAKAVANQPTRCQEGEPASDLLKVFSHVWSSPVARVSWLVQKDQVAIARGGCP